MKRQLVLIIPFMFIFASCSTYSGQDIAEDIEKISTEEKRSIIPYPSNRRVNEAKQVANEEIREYGEQFGYYLKQFNEQMEKVAPFFYTEQPTEAQLTHTIREAEQLRHLRNVMTSYQRPEQLTSLHNVHHAMLRELDLLLDALQKVNVHHQPSFERAKQHFENTVISLQLTEREYLTIVTEYGL